MAMNLLPSHMAGANLSIPAGAIVISCFVYLFGRALFNLIRVLVPLDVRKATPLASGLDQAEKGSLRKQEDMSDDDVFQLEKRAFFSKVGPHRLFLIDHG